MQIIKKYIKMLRKIIIAFACLFFSLMIIRNIQGTEYLYQFIKYFFIIIFCIWLLLYSAKKIHGINFLYKPFKYIIISCISIFFIIIAFLFIWYNYFFFPCDQDYLQGITDSVKYSGDYLEERYVDLIREIKNAKFSNPLSKKDHDFLFGNLKEKDFYINKNPYGHNHANNLKYSTGRIFYYTYQKNSIVLKADSRVSYTLPESAVKRFLELDAVYPKFGALNTDGLINVYFTFNNYRTHLLKKTIHREGKPDIKPFRYSSPISSICFYLKHPGRSVLTNYTGWEKIRVDLPSGPGELEIEFKSAGGERNFLFIGSPAVYTHHKKKRNDHVNIVYLIFDTLSKQHVDLYEYYDLFSKMTPEEAYAKIGRRGIITPAIDKYADRICLLDNMFTAGQVTRPAIVALWTSQVYTKCRLPVFRNIVTEENENEFYSQKFGSLGNELSRNSYFTKQISCNAQGHGVSGVGVDLGFDENYDYTMEATEKPENFRRIIEFLNENQNRKFFLYAHVNVPHTPKWIPLRYVASSLPDVRFNTGSAVRLGNIRYLNDSLAKVMNTLEKLRLMGNTMIIITSDHSGGRVPYYRGELSKKDINKRLRESQRVADFFNRAIYTRKGSVHLYNDYMNIPWILIYPANKNFIPGKIDSYTSSLDISPTLLDISLKKTNPEFSGRSFKNLLLNKDKRDGIFSEFIPLVGRFQRGFVLDGRYKYWINLQGLYKYRVESGKKYIMQQEALYDLKADPDEINNLAKDIYNNGLLQKMRKIYFERFIDYPDKNIIQISRSDGSSINLYSITASSNGNIIIPKTYGEGIKYRYNSKNEIIFTCKVRNKPAFLSFETNPPESAIKISVNKNNRPLPRANIFSAVESINYFNNPIILNDRADFYIAREPGRTGLEHKDIPEESLFFSRIPLNYWLEMNLSDKDIKLSPGMKEVLRGWGYIQ